MSEYDPDDLLDIPDFLRAKYPPRDAETACSCPRNTWGGVDCQESTAPGEYCAWERQQEEKSQADGEAKP